MRWFQVWGWRDLDCRGRAAVPVFAPGGQLAALVFSRGDLGYRVVAYEGLTAGAYLMADAPELVEAVGFAQAWAESV